MYVCMYVCMYVRMYVCMYVSYQEEKMSVVLKPSLETMYKLFMKTSSCPTAPYKCFCLLADLFRAEINDNIMHRTYPK